MPWGRPAKITDIVLSKLEDWFAMGFTDNEACLYADVAPATLYRYIEANPKFWERKELLKDQPKMVAKANLIKSIHSTNPLYTKQKIDDSKWWLERKSRNEFSLRQEIQAEVEGDITVKFEM